MKNVKLLMKKKKKKKKNILRLLLSRKTCRCKKIYLQRNSNLRVKECVIWSVRFYYCCELVAYLTQIPELCQEKTVTNKISPKHLSFNFFALFKQLETLDCAVPRTKT